MLVCVSAPSRPKGIAVERMTSTEAETIVRNVLAGLRELERSAKFFDELLEEGFTVQDINPILRSHRMLGAPEWVPDKNAFRVRLLGTCLEGRPTLLIVDLRPTGPCSLVTIMERKVQKRLRRAR